MSQSSPPEAVDTHDSRSALEGSREPARGGNEGAAPPLVIRKRSRGWVAWVVVLVVLLGGAFAHRRYAEAHRAPDIQYKTQAIEARRIVGRVTASGTLQATVTVQVGTQVSGRIQHLYADFNAPVKKGQLVAKIDPQIFQANVAQAHANYVSAEAALVQAQAKALDADRVFNRTKALRDQNLASQADLDTAETSLAVAKSGIDVAKANVEQNKAALNQADVNLSYTNIMSPIDGVVISRSVDVGQTVAASLQAPTLFTIAEDLRKMQVNTNVAEGDVGRLKADMPAYFSVDAFPGQVFKGKISQIRNAPQTVQNVVTYDAVIDVDNDDLRLRPGMTANVTVIYDSKDHAIAVPNAALRFRPPAGMGFGGGASDAPSGSSKGRRAQAASPETKDPASEARTVWVLRGGNPEAVSVKVGLSDGTVSELTSGDLKEGDQVIVDATSSTAPSGSSGSPGGSGPSMRRLF